MTTFGGGAWAEPRASDMPPPPDGAEARASDVPPPPDGAEARASDVPPPPEHPMTKMIRHHLTFGEPVPRDLFDLAIAAGMPAELASRARPFLQPDRAEEAMAAE